MYMYTPGKLKYHESKIGKTKLKAHELQREWKTRLKPHKLQREWKTKLKPHKL